MAKDAEVLEITAIQDVDGNAYVFTVCAHSSEIPYYHSADICRGFDDFCFGVDPYSLQKLTAWFADAVLRISKSVTVKRTRIQHKEDVIIFTLRPHASKTQSYQLDIRTQAAPGLGIRFWVDLYGLQKLTAWFAEAALSVKKYEDASPWRWMSNAAS